MSRLMLACLVLAALTISERPAHAQGDDSVLNGTIIGAAVGAGLGVAFTHAVRDSDLTFSQYSRSALIFGAMGAGAGLGWMSLTPKKGTACLTLATIASCSTDCSYCCSSPSFFIISSR
jgi:hypothetical protein